MNTKTDNQTASAQPENVRKIAGRLWYGAFSNDGKLRATFDSPSEAYHYTQNRGHMWNGSDKPIPNYKAHADKLAEALRKSADTFNDLAKALRLLKHGTMAHACDIAEQSTREALAAYEAAQ